MLCKVGGGVFFTVLLVLGIVELLLTFCTGFHSVIFVVFGFVYSGMPASTASTASPVSAASMSAALAFAFVFGSVLWVG